MVLIMTNYFLVNFVYIHTHICIHTPAHMDDARPGPSWSCTEAVVATLPLTSQSSQCWITRDQVHTSEGFAETIKTYFWSTCIPYCALTHTRLWKSCYGYVVLIHMASEGDSPLTLGTTTLRDLWIPNQPSCVVTSLNSTVASSVLSPPTGWSVYITVTTVKKGLNLRWRTVCNTSLYLFSNLYTCRWFSVTTWKVKNFLKKKIFQDWSVGVGVWFKPEIGCNDVWMFTTRVMKSDRLGSIVFYTALLWLSHASTFEHL